MAKGLTAADILKAISIVGSGIGASALPGSSGVLSVVGRGGFIPQGKFAGRNAAGPGATLGDMSVLRAQYGASNYPREFYPSASGHTVEVNYFPGPAQMNAMLNPTIAKEAGRMQTLDEHNNALLQFVRPGMNPAEIHEAVQMGRDAERQLPQFWADSAPRKNYSPSSSAVSGVRITPDGNIEVKWGKKDKWYTFRQYPNTYEASLAMQELLSSDSIGRAVMPTQRHGKVINYKNPNLGWWNRVNYDSSYSAG